MKVLLHSHAFWPQLGGIESVSRTLARALTAAGHSVTVVTETRAAESELDEPYRLVRNPDALMRRKLVASHDLVHANGASLRFFFLAGALGKPFSWTHQGYQLQCIDGAGWVEGNPAPLSPGKSMQHHLGRFGLQRTAVGAVKLSWRRFAAQQASANVAITEHLARCQPLPRQVVIYNPIEFEQFAVGGFDQARQNFAHADTTFFFLGRLISEKGVDDLLHAFAQLTRLRSAAPITLKIIGDGPQRGALVRLAEELGIRQRTIFTGAKSGADLASAVNQAGICVLPSAWEEPMGIVALELMAAGKPLIVSARGGLSECCGDAAVTFPNRNREELLRAMLNLYDSESLQLDLIERALSRVQKFDPMRQISAYLELFDRILYRSGRNHSQF